MTRPTYELEQPTRLVVNHGKQKRQERVNVFNEMPAEGEEIVAPPPVRQIVVTDEMRRRDAELQRKRAAAVSSDWTIKAELRAENLRGWANATVKPGRVQPKPTESRVASPVHVKAPRVRRRQPTAVETVSNQDESIAPESETSAKPVETEAVEDERIPCRCGRLIQQRFTERKLCGGCYKRSLRSRDRLARRPVCAKEGCWQLVRAGKQRLDGLCGRCGGIVDRRAARQVGCRLCEICQKPLRRGCTTNACSWHHRGGSLVTVLRAGNEAERKMDREWAKLPWTSKAFVIGNLQAGTP